ncbi:DUF1349 domain-containing protein [Paraburkholderia sp. LEh10]|jgi:hypothetical protein|uniref:DUF1349 domain-containing protein n=1 Tax=Paraburkholderia sp. LEh10 TaxID=2821353 RepID=UPI001AE93250|nr:DUF1349 domain-containing protein [Paraburkholderia sp. LEh10]
MLAFNKEFEWLNEPAYADPIDKRGIRIRMTRHAEPIRIQYLNWFGSKWYPIRLAYFPPTRSVEFGLVCCSPQREGFVAYFEDYGLSGPIPRELHG